MKNKIAIASAFLAASSFSTAEIVVNDFLSFEGFVDMSYSHTDTDNPDTSSNSFQVDQVEISWMFDFDPVTAQIDLQYEDIANSGSIDPITGDLSDGNVVEQAFATYSLANGGAITAGRYASMLGFEAFEPTGLYQYSFAYDVDVGLPGYAQGVKYTYETDTTFFGISLQDEAFDNGNDALGGNPDSTFAVEVAGSVAMDNGVSFFLGGVMENADNADPYTINSYVTFETGAWIFAGELNYADDDAGTELTSMLLMANFAYSDLASVTGRISFIDADFGATDEEWMKFTLAHGYAFTDNLFLVTEISYSEFDTADTETLFGAVELLFTF